ncbi:transposase [Paenibacillus sp. FSL R7-0204]|uniref:transposase n=1 Tax=Paenibacillus sp. FSL R7-0204 TaxID=2921675 RepID=UPI0030F9F837
MNYHFVFCPRYRRKVLVDQVEIQFKQIVIEICAEREQFKHLNHLQSLWTRSYLVSTAENVSSETIQRYVEEQKARG